MNKELKHRLHQILWSISEVLGSYLVRTKLNPVERSVGSLSCRRPRCQICAYVNEMVLTEMELYSLTMAFLSKFGYIKLAILSCYGSLPVLFGDWEGWWFEHFIIKCHRIIFFREDIFIKTPLYFGLFKKTLYIYIYIYIHYIYIYIIYIYIHYIYREIPIV